MIGNVSVILKEGSTRHLGAFFSVPETFRRISGVSMGVLGDLR